MTTRLSPFAVLLCATALSASEPTKKSFCFGDGPDIHRTTRIQSDASYGNGTGHGFEPGATVRFENGTCTSEKPFCFSVAVPEGNYSVFVALGGTSGESKTTVKSELRRLSLEQIRTGPSASYGSGIVVNVRTPKISTGGEVKLKDREKTSERWAWDEKLTIEFNGTKPSVKSIEIVAIDVPTIYLLGDSTVCDQPSEPYASWGQMLPRFFGGNIAVANHAQSGESLRSSLGAKRLDKVLSTIKPGDWLMLQYGHNDMKVVTADVYKKDLKHFADEAKKKGAKVVLITPMHRRTFKDGKITNSHKDFPDAVRSLAKEESLPLIDLHAKSATLYESFGPEKSAVLFKSGDGTHHNNYGAYQLAKCVVEGIRANKLELTKHIVADLKPYDPAKPDPVESFAVPASPTGAGGKPDGK